MRPASLLVRLSLALPLALALARALRVARVVLVRRHRRQWRADPCEDAVVAARHQAPHRVDDHQPRDAHQPEVLARVLEPGGRAQHEVEVVAEQQAQPRPERHVEDGADAPRHEHVPHVVDRVRAARGDGVEGEGYCDEVLHPVEHDLVHVVQAARVGEQRCVHGQRLPRQHQRKQPASPRRRRHDGDDEAQRVEDVARHQRVEQRVTLPLVVPRRDHEHTHEGLHVERVGLARWRRDVLLPRPRADDSICQVRH
mmetsp:Transcript_14686/g.51137  ORF Transcript_14686/g.51137 Transcript_14686/m.51137 type:complete len:255 (-) Transcript_14686:188-952(-)